MERQDSSLTDLLGQLTHEMGDLVRQEVALAKTELTQKAYHVGKQTGFLAAGAALGYAGLLAILGALIVVLRKMGLGWAFSAFLVGFGTAGLGGALAWKGFKSLQQEDLLPEHTIATLKENTGWGEAQMT